MTEEDKRKQWYVVQVLSGQEHKVLDNLTKRIKTEEMGDHVFEVLLPIETVSEIKHGKKTETKRKLLPGYLIVNMWLWDERRDDNQRTVKELVGKTWYFVRDTPGVIGFAGTKDHPTPMLPAEVERIQALVHGTEDKVKPKFSFEVGDTVKVADGPFQNQSGTVEEIDPERGKLRVSVSIFGRNTLVDLEYWQVERAEPEAEVKSQKV
ncbi:MAG: Transcription termination/antitermination protein NusG [Verrucomicrobiota bacterium]|jgi:transcriptional antiterminator NusG